MEDVSPLIDSQGFRANVGIMLMNSNQQILWAKRTGEEIWQCPQGGVCVGESLIQAMYRELYEEIGLRQIHVECLGKTKNWMPYRFPEPRSYGKNNQVYIGQKQIWFLLTLVAHESNISLDKSDTPEFEDWQWVDYWHPINHIVKFKQSVYRAALEELAPLRKK